MIKPIPCKKFRGASTVAWMAKLSEETNEVLQEAADYWDIVERCGIESGDRIADTRERLVMELTDVMRGILMMRRTRTKMRWVICSRRPLCDGQRNAASSIGWTSRMGKTICMICKQEGQNDS